MWYSQNTLSPPLTSLSATGIGGVGLSRYTNMENYRTPGYANYVNGGHQGMRTAPNPYYPPNQYAPYSTRDQTYSSGMTMPHTEPHRAEGPPFLETKVLKKVATSRQELQPDLSANFQKGFFQVDDKWTCYRRNYFHVACSFILKNHLAESPLYLTMNHQLEPIVSFSVSISAKTASGSSQESEPRGLVQHTPKRNKESESTPERHLLQPASPQAFHHNGALNMPASAYSGNQVSAPGAYGSFDGSAQQSIPTSYTFERIQFQKATANNGKRRAQQQYFHIVVELSASIRSHGREQWVLIATKESEPVVVRGRSPGHYKDNVRRDSQTSMDPDCRGGGGGSDGSSISYPNSTSQSTGMEWTYTGRGHHYHSSGTNYRQHVPSEDSPPSAASSTTLTGSPDEADFALSDPDALKSPGVFNFDRTRLTSPSDTADEPFFTFDRSAVSRKRPLEDDSADEGSPYRIGQPFSDGIASHAFELPHLARTKALCVRG